MKQGCGSANWSKEGDTNPIPDQRLQKRWPLEPRSSRKHLEHPVSHSWGHFPGVGVSEARTVHFLPLQVTGLGGDPPGSRPPKPRVWQAGAETHLARRSRPVAVQGRAPPGGSRQSTEDTERNWENGSGALQRGLMRGGGRGTGGLLSKSRKHP